MPTYRRAEAQDLEFHVDEDVTLRPPNPPRLGAQVHFNTKVEGEPLPQPGDVHVTNRRHENGDAFYFQAEVLDGEPDCVEGIETVEVVPPPCDNDPRCDPPLRLNEDGEVEVRQRRRLPEVDFNTRLRINPVTDADLPPALQGAKDITPVPGAEDMVESFKAAIEKGLRAYEEEKKAEFRDANGRLRSKNGRFAWDGGTKRERVFRTDFFRDEQGRLREPNGRFAFDGGTEQDVKEWEEAVERISAQREAMQQPNMVEDPHNVATPVIERDVEAIRAMVQREMEMKMGRDRHLYERLNRNNQLGSATSITYTTEPTIYTADAFTTTTYTAPRIEMRMEHAPMTITSASTGENAIFQTVNEFVRDAQTHGLNLTIHTAGTGDTTIRIYATEVNHTMNGTTELVWRAWADCNTCGTATIDPYGHVNGRVTAAVWDAWAGRFENDNVYRVRNPYTQEARRDEVRQRRGVPYGFVKMSRAERDAWEAREIAEHLRREEERQNYERRLAAERAARELAERKAYELMMTYLTPEQREEFERFQRFHVIGKEGNLYRIKKGSHGNVELIEVEGEGEAAVQRAVESLCFQPSGQIPCFDAMLAQKLALETDEEDARRIANITNLRAYRHAAG